MRKPKLAGSRFFKIPWKTNHMMTLLSKLLHFECVGSEVERAKTTLMLPYGRQHSCKPPLKLRAKYKLDFKCQVFPEAGL